MSDGSARQGQLEASSSLFLSAVWVRKALSAAALTAAAALAAPALAADDATNAPAGNNLVLVLRNVGAKWVNFPDSASGDFTLKDSRGRAMKLELRAPPQPISYGEATVLQIFVPKTAEESKPWTLRFKSSSAAKIPFDISISGIKP